MEGLSLTLVIETPLKSLVSGLRTSIRVISHLCDDDVVQGVYTSGPVGFEDLVHSTTPLDGGRVRNLGYLNLGWDRTRPRESFQSRLTEI